MPDGTAPPGERSAMSEETRTMQTADNTPARAPEDAPSVGKENRQDHLQGARPFQPDQH